MKPTKTAAIVTFTIVALAAHLALAGQADVMDVKVSLTSGGTYRFDVTINHMDEGWEHYDDTFEIVSPDGRVLGKRVLAHPHVNEQPFTRSLSGVDIPDDIKEVTVRAHDKIHGLGGAIKRIKLP